MPLEWAISQHTETAQNIHQSQYSNTGDTSIKDAVNASLEKAIDLLPNNIQDDSLYFLVEWHSHNNTLSIVVTDDTKQKEAPEVVQCVFATDASTTTDNYAENIQFLTRDYLTTSGGFIRFSLVAVFGLGERRKVELL